MIGVIEKLVLEGLHLDSEMTSDISWMPSPFSNHFTVSFENLVLEQLCMTFVKKTNF